MTSGIPTKQWTLMGRGLSVLAFPAFAILGTLCSSTTDAGIPFHRRKLPGAEKGKAEIRWIAPYVLATRYSVEGTAITTVRWFDDKGRVARELSGPGVDARTDYLLERAAPETVIHDVNGQWKLALPKKPGPAGYITAVGEVFVHQFHPAEGQIAADVYVAGRRTGTVGPFVQYKGRGVRLANDGSSAFLTWKGSKKETVQVVVVGRDGNIRLRADCGEDADDPYAVGGGKGVLVRVVGREEPPVRFRYLHVGATWLSFDVGPNAYPMACTPQEGTVLFHTSIGEKEQFRLVDCRIGKAAWEIPSPVQYYDGVVSSALFVDDKILFVGRDFAAVDVRSGKLIARWQPNVPRSDRGWLARRKDHHFVVTREEFVEINLADIAAKSNGWN